MAKRGTVKAKSLYQENYLARTYGGKRSPSSGASFHDAGDIRTDRDLLEAKVTGAPGRKEISKPKHIKELEKVAVEAWTEGRNPVLCVRYYLPDSPLADVNGWVDIAIRLVADDAERNYVPEDSNT